MSADLMGGNRLGSQRDEYVEEIDYAPMGKPFLQKISFLGILTAIGCLVLIVLLNLLFVRLLTSGMRTRMVALEDRISYLENRQISLDGVPDVGSQIDEQEKRVEGLTARVNRMEAAMPAIMDQIKSELDTLQKKTAAAKSKPPAKPSPSAKPKAAAKPAPGGTSSKASPPVFHTVSKGDTLYSISRAYKDRYGLTLDKIREVNNLGAGASIYPGQRIIVGP